MQLEPRQVMFLDIRTAFDTPFYFHFLVWDSMMEGNHAHSTTPNPKGQSLDETDDMAAGDEQGAASDVHETQSKSQAQSFLLGPMVVRVLPNGMPIPGKQNSPKSPNGLDAPNSNICESGHTSSIPDRSEF